MLTRLRHIPEPYRMLFIGLCTLVVMIAGYTWPNLAYAIWGIFVALMAALLYADLKEPVNYESIYISAETVEYIAAGQRKIIRLDEVSRLEFVREEALFPDLEGPYIESKWLVHTRDGSFIEVMDEWPHRKKLLKAFKESLPHFDKQAARKGFRAWGEGKWLCYDGQTETERDA